MSGWRLTVRPIDLPDDSVDASLLRASELRRLSDPARLRLRTADGIVHAGDLFDICAVDAPHPTLWIDGNASFLSRIGGAADGEASGLGFETIVVDGNVGSMVAHRMRRGLVAIHGRCGPMLGAGMVAGTILQANDSKSAETANDEETMLIGAMRGTLLTSEIDHLPTTRFTGSVRMRASFLAPLLEASPSWPHALRSLLRSAIRSGVRCRRGDRCREGLAEAMCPMDPLI